MKRSTAFHAIWRQPTKACLTAAAMPRSVISGAIVVIGMTKASRGAAITPPPNPATPRIA
jgi:hypothetical protein